MDHSLTLRNCCKLGASLLLVLLIPSFTPAAAQTGDAANGQKVYMEKCKKCHGEDGSANTNFGKSLKAADLRSADVQKKTDADFYTQVEKGKKNMPSFGAELSKKDINDVIAYVREIGKKANGKTK